MQRKPIVVSMTPAVFHLSEAVNAVSRRYGESPIVPRGPRLRPLLEAVRGGVVQALGLAEHDAVFMTGTGSSAMAAVLGSCLRPDERLLVVRNGAYGDRILEFASRLGQPIVDMSLPYGESPDLAEVERRLAGDAVDAIAIVYGATSSCTLNPVAEIGALATRYGKKLLVDGVSSLFVEPMDERAFGAAAVMGSCNKGLHAHPNLSFALVRHDLLAAMAEIPQRVPSLELYKLDAAQRAGSHPYTIDPMSLLQVQAALDHLASQGGVAGRHAIYAERARLLRAGYERLGLRIARFEGAPLSSIGTTLAIPDGVSYDALAERLASHEVDGHVFEIYSAQGKLSKRLFRVFHMGDYPLEVYEIFLHALGQALETSARG